MKRMLKKIRFWFGLEEPRWWDEIEADPVRLIQGAPFAAALDHRRACA